MQKISIIGAGTMGVDIARTFAAKNFDVVIRDISDEIINRSAEKLKKTLSRAVEKGRLTAEAMDSTLGHISFTTSLEASRDCDVVIEAIIENAKIKKELFAALDEICKPETIIASNTSSLSITDLSSAVKRQDKFIGMHFFNPVPSMALVEVVRGLFTSDESNDAILKLAVAVDKDPVQVKDAPGFIVNKILIPMVNEAIVVLQDGVASAEDIDKAMRLGANHPMGPLSLSDLIGNDVVLHIMNILYEETGDPKYRAATLLKSMVRAGLLGRKTGKGFFTYSK